VTDARTVARIRANNLWASGRRPTWRDRLRFRAQVRAMAARCRCTCPRSAHDHYRPGTDCGRCGRAVCPGFRRQRRPFKIIFRRKP